MSPVARLVGFLVVIPLCALVFVPLERAFPIQERKRILRRDAIIDYLFFFAGLVIVVPLAPPIRTAFVAFVLGPLIPGWDTGQIMRGYGIVAALPLWALLPLLTVVHDFLEYWLHRALHTRWFWRFHVAHHSAREMDWLVFCRNHPIEGLMHHVFRGSILVLLGFPFEIVAVYDATFFGLVGILTHANINVRAWNRAPWKYILASPMFHHWHHTAEREGLDKNLCSVFPIWDILFGTFYMPDRAPRVYGLIHPINESFLGLLGSAFYAQDAFDEQASVREEDRPTKPFEAENGRTTARLPD
ncbi:sterol desaturase family protein [Pendulispora albinea]|uniref:Sterol desaturase family protein n=1 Tax=Pendulispora albinea TaxID=2741071 RepID=A0ABZ2LMG5_9BACT